MSQNQSAPNVIVFMTDDQGYGDLSCMGATDFSTPNLDRLASEGVRFTDWYSNSPVCSPSRAALLTGRYPGNAGVRAILQGHRTASGLPNSTPTLSSLLKDRDYQTAMIGKWHLGLTDKCRPHSHGFDYWFGFLAGCIDFYSHIYYWGANRPGPGVNPTHDLWENNEEVWMDGQYFTELIAEKTIDRLRVMKHQKRRNGEPFFLYVPFNAPHYPMHAPNKYTARFVNLPWDRRIMAAMVSAVDDAVGAIMNEVKRLGESENTLTFFVSDNGPSRETRNWLDGTLDPYYGGTSGGLRGHKFSLFEGGIRMPAIAHYPARIPPGQVISQPCASMDIVPTVLHAVDAAAPDAPQGEFDGVSILESLINGTELPERDIYWELDGQSAIRRGRWKLVIDGVLVEEDEPSEHLHLADLQDDIAEENNLAGMMPQLASELQDAALSWRAKIEDRWERDYASLGHGIVTYADFEPDRSEITTVENPSKPVSMRIDKRSAIQKINAFIGRESLNHSNTHFANVNKSIHIWWFSIPIERFQNELHLILAKDSGFIWLKIEAETFPSYTLFSNRVREGKRLIDLNICSNADDHRYLFDVKSSKTRYDFRPYIENEWED